MAYVALGMEWMNVSMIPASENPSAFITSSSLSTQSVVKGQRSNLLHNRSWITQCGILQKPREDEYVQIYRIAGNFRGVQFPRFSQLIDKPRKLNPRNKVNMRE